MTFYESGIQGLVLKSVLIKIMFFLNVSITWKILFSHDHAHR